MATHCRHERVAAAVGSIACAPAGPSAPPARRNEGIRGAPIPIARSHKLFEGNDMPGTSCPWPSGARRGGPEARDRLEQVGDGVRHARNGTFHANNSLVKRYIEPLQAYIGPL
jgi:hypothetical protein